MWLCRGGSCSSCAKQRASFRASGGSALAKNSWASGARVTSNIRAHLAPVDPLAGGDCLLGSSQALHQRPSIEELYIVGQRLKALGRQLIDRLLDFAAKFSGAHSLIVSQ